MTRTAHVCRRGDDRGSPVARRGLLFGGRRPGRDRGRDLEFRLPKNWASPMSVFRSPARFCAVSPILDAGEHPEADVKQEQQDQHAKDRIVPCSSPARVVVRAHRVRKAAPG